MVWEEETMGVKSTESDSNRLQKHLTSILAKVEPRRKKFGHYELTKEPKDDNYDPKCN